MATRLQFRRAWGVQYFSEIMLETPRAILVSPPPSMKKSRLLFVVAGAVAVLLVLAVVVAFSSTFQTWVVRRAIADRPGLKMTVGSVSAGLSRVELKDVRFDQDGALLTVPSLQLEMPLLAA